MCVLIHLSAYGLQVLGEPNSGRMRVEGRTLKFLHFFHFFETSLMSFTKIPVLLQYLFMKKLMILSLKFFRLSEVKFFLSRFNNVTQFLYTSSVILSLEFVFSNLHQTVSEDLLLLSVQESPSLFVFRVFLQNDRLTDADVIVVSLQGIAARSWIPGRNRHKKLLGIFFMDEFFLSC